MDLLREFCAENMEHVKAAVDAGARRIELCDNLAVGGTTPSVGVIRAAAAFAREAGVAVMAMVRPRGGDFVYSELEAQMMRDDLLTARALGVTGVVFGCVRPDEAGTLHIDRELTRELVECAKGELPADLGFSGACADPVQITFHMAFDDLAAAEQLEAIDYLAELGVERILTHGGPKSKTIFENLPRLKELIDYADGRLTILPGAGITFENVEEIASELGVHEAHGTKIVRIA